MTIEPVYITATQAISWIAFRDFDGIKQKFFDGDYADLKKWRFSDKGVLLACLMAIKNNEDFSATEWLEKTDYCGAELSLESTKEILSQLLKSYNSIEEIINDLEISIKNSLMNEQKLELAETEFIELLRSEKIEMRGKEENDNESKICSINVLLLDNYFFYLLEEKVRFSQNLVSRVFSSLKVKKESIVKLFPENSGVHTNKVIEENHKQSRDNDLHIELEYWFTKWGSPKTNKECWKNLCGMDFDNCDYDTVIQRVDNKSNNKDECKIFWKSALGTEREMKRSTFENVMSKLRKK